MESESKDTLGALLEPFHASCGPRLAMRRSGNVVCWTLEARAAYVVADDDGVSATFADDACARAQSHYRLTGDDARRLATDLVAFFSADGPAHLTVYAESEFARA